MSFDELSGNLIEADYIPPDPNHLTGTYNAFLGPGGGSFLVSDINPNAIQEYG